MLVETPLRSVRDIMLMLRSLPDMDKVDPDDLTMLAEHAKPRHYHAGQPLSMTGPSGRVVHLLVRGSVEITRGPHKERVDGAGGVGFAELFAERPAAPAVAVSASTTLEVSADFLLRAIEDNFGFFRQALRGHTELLLALGNGLPQVRRDPTMPVSRPRQLFGDTLVDRLSFLEGTVLDQASLDATIALARSMRRVKFARGEVIFAEGEPARWWLSLVSGRIRCSNAAGEVEVADDYVIGVLDTVADHARSYTAHALVEVEGYRIDIEHWSSVLQTHSDLAMGVLRLTSEMFLELSASAAESQVRVANGSGQRTEGGGLGGVRPVPVSE